MLCEHYWPADSRPITHGRVTIRLLAEQPQDEWTTREFQLHHVRAREGSGEHSFGRVNPPLGLWPPACPGGWWFRKGRAAEWRLRVIRGRERKDVSACAVLGSGPRAPSASWAVTSWGSGAPLPGHPRQADSLEAGGARAATPGGRGQPARGAWWQDKG